VRTAGVPTVGWPPRSWAVRRTTTGVAGRTLLAAHFLPHLHETWLAGLDPAPDELAARLDRTTEDLEEVEPVDRFESVGVSDQSQAARQVLCRPPRTACVGFIIDRDTHASERCDIEHSPTGSSEVEIEQRNRTTVAEYDVLEADVVVAKDWATVRIGHLFTSGPGGQIDCG